MTNVLVSGRVLDAQVGGNTRYARTIYGGLARHGVSHRIARPPLAKGRLRSLSYAGFESVIWPLSPGRDVDVIHYPADTGAQISGRTPIVSTVHGLATMHVENVRSSRADRIWRQRVARMVELSTTVVTVSHSSGRDIAKLVPSAAGKIVPILHGIDHSTFNAVAGESDAEYRAEVGATGEYFLYLGNLDPRKNIIELCAAAEKTFEQTGIPLLISGAPAWESEKILEAVKNTKGVVYLGRVSDTVLVPLIRGALAFCFPSTYEGFGFPVIEAMACGAPVICSDRGSLGEVTGDAAFILDEIDRVSIASAMIEVARDSGVQADLRERGLQNVKRFQWEDSIRAHAEVFTEAAR